MGLPEIPRREFLQMLTASFAAAHINWDDLPVNRCAGSSDYDAVIIGAGLGGLSCAAAFARQGFKPLVIEHHDKPGGYATAFARPGGFVFDASLHSTTAGKRDGLHNLIQGFPEITSVDFLLHPTLLRSVFPEHDIRIAQQDPGALVQTLIGHFPEEKEGIRGLFADMQGLAEDVSRLGQTQGRFDRSRFAADFPSLAKFGSSTWGQMMDAHVRNPKLKGILSCQWGYYGLPPSRLSCFYYALPFMGYLSGGGAYPRGRSQDISNALAEYIRGHGGTIVLNTRVDRILVKDKAASGVVTADGRTHTGRVVVSNASPFETFGRLLSDRDLVADYETRMKQYSVSLSCFQVFLGLKEDLVAKAGITDSEIFVEPSYDPEEGYRTALSADVEHGGVSVTFYDNIYRGYSPPGKNTLNIMTLQGYGPWEEYAKDYLAGRKEAYRRKKEKMADILIRKVEGSLVPGLSRAIEVREVATPLTNERYTRSHRGAIYGWDQTVNNSGGNRVGHATPVQNLYLAGAWSRPGHGYGAVIPSGLECCAEIVKDW